MNGLADHFVRGSAPDHIRAPAGGLIDWSTVRRLAVFRALNLGDILCSVPALRALRRWVPNAHITLIGLPAARPVLEFFPGLVDEWVEFPGDPAFPEQDVATHALPAFYRAMQARRFDIAIQLHGSGARSNDIVQALGPAQWAGFVADEHETQAGRLLPWPDHLHEVHRYLALLEHIGVPTDGDRYALQPLPADVHQAQRLAGEAGLTPGRMIIVHPGARLRSRCWPVERFAAVAAALADEGWQIALTGSPSECERVQAVLARAQRPLANLCGATGLGVLAALLQRCRLLVCNDTGISHVAAGVGARSVVIASGSDVRRWAPLDTQTHRVLHKDLPCRPCAHETCPIGHPCALGVEVEQVLAAARQHLREAAR